MDKNKTKLLAIVVSLIAIGTLSTNMLAYANPPSLNITIPSNPTPPCSEGQTTSNYTLLCQSGTNLLCNSSREGYVSNDGSLECTSGKWKTVSSSGSNSDGSTSNPQTPTAKITKVSVSPQAFNPSIDNTKINYSTSLKSLVDIKITDSFGQTVGNLVDNQSLSAGTYYVIWYGTINNKQGGTVLHSGTYHYKIVTKNTKTNKVEDSKEGDINLIFAAQDQVVDPTPIYTAPATTPAAQSAQTNATLVLQNTQKGKTPKTGPDILIYGAFPVIGYFLSRRRK